MLPCYVVLRFHLSFLYLITFNYYITVFVLKNIIFLNTAWIFLLHILFILPVVSDIFTLYFRLIFAASNQIVTVLFTCLSKFLRVKILEQSSDKRGIYVFLKMTISMSQCLSFTYISFR
jgi:hypothetical protein